MDKDGKVVPFRLNEAQEKFFSEIWNRNIILKARQRGFSTLIQIVMLDQCVFRDNIRAGVVAQDKDAATVIFRDKIKFGYDHLPPMVREARPLITDSAQELVMANNSSLRVATSMRSGTLQFLHVSEFGKICAKYPAKAREVVTGSLPAVAKDGFTFIESTAEGQEGRFYEMCEQARKAKLEKRTLGPEDFRFHFFGWWDAAEYSIESSATAITEEDDKYFDSLESKVGREIDAGHRRWYVTKRAVDFGGDSQMMKQEYPSLPEEAFEQSLEGCYYSEQMTAVRKEGRIGRVPYMPGYPVNTFWDIGRTDGTAIWFHQRIGTENRFIRFYEEWDKHFSHYVAEMQKFGYVWGKHYLPHDAAHKKQGATDNKSPEQMLNDLGLRDTVIVPRIDIIQTGIQMVRAIFPSCAFDKENCAKGIAHIDAYRKEWDPRRGRWGSEPEHNIHSEAADALRQFAQGYKGDRKPAASDPFRLHI
jgi:hypothetical protein